MTIGMILGALLIWYFVNAFKTNYKEAVTPAPERVPCANENCSRTVPKNSEPLCRSCRHDRWLEEQEEVSTCTLFTGRRADQDKKIS